MITGTGSKDEKAIKTFRISEGQVKPVQVRVGERFLILIGSNVTTGYSWSPGNAQGNEYFSYQEYPEEECPPQDEDFKGAPGTDCLLFQALKSGETFIILEYSRPWEKNKAPLKTLKIPLNIQ